MPSTIASRREPAIMMPSTDGSGGLALPATGRLPMAARCTTSPARPVVRLDRRARVVCHSAPVAAGSARRIRRGFTSATRTPFDAGGKNAQRRRRADDLHERPRRAERERRRAPRGSEAECRWPSSARPRLFGRCCAQIGRQAALVCTGTRGSPDDATAAASCNDAAESPKLRRQRQARAARPSPAFPPRSPSPR